MERTAFRTCPFCEATCGLEVTLRGDEVVKVRGDAEDVFSHGYLCPKGVALKELHDDPDRLRTPLVRDAGGELRPASWEAAFATVAERLAAVTAAHGRDAVAVYIGNPAAHGLAALLYGRVLIKALGTRSVFSASTVDQRPKEISCGLMFGAPLSVPIPDVDRTQHLLMLGANPLASNGSLFTAPDLRGRLRALQARGGKLVVDRPAPQPHRRGRPTSTIRSAPAPTRCCCSRSCTCCSRRRSRRPGRLAALTDGIDAVRDLARPFTPEAVAPATAIAAHEIRRMARELAAAERPAVYGRIGTTTQEFGTLASWLVDVLNVLTGNLDRPGRRDVPARRCRPAQRGRRAGNRARRHRRALALARARPAGEPGRAARRGARRGDRGAGRGAAPRARHAGRQPRAVDAELGADGARARVAGALRRRRHLRQRDDPPRRRDPARAVAAPALALRPRALPARDPQRGQLLAARAAARPRGARRVGDAAAARQPSRRGSPRPTTSSRSTGSSPASCCGARPASPHSPLHGLDVEALLAELEPRRGPERLLDLLLRAGPYDLTLADLEAAPHGIDLGPLEPRLPGVLRTPSGRIELAPAPIACDVARLRDALARPREPGALVLVGRRQLRSNNSWMHNLELLVTRARSAARCRCTRTTRQRLGLADGDAARVRSRAGELEAPVEVTDAVMAGVVSLPHGWGHDAAGARMDVAGAHAGVNANLLADEGQVDALSGNAVLNGIPVAVAPVPAAVPVTA